MGGYLANFTVYTMAMLGVIFAALFIYKKFICVNAFGKKSEFLGVEESISLAPRKNLYVVRAGNERFLVASDADRTSLISKLDDNSKPRRVDANMEELPVILDFPKRSDQPIIKEMLKKINEL
ncbi:FliO/MopB family protein [bacterium]|nr:FliO/MopB family protein [bacterium]